MTANYGQKGVRFELADAPEQSSHRDKVFSHVQSIIPGHFSTRDCGRNGFPL
jgi:hypothetical protein